ncbi:MAG: VCBS repeat-containing protein [Litoreibacter sp.]
MSRHFWRAFSLGALSSLSMLHAGSSAAEIVSATYVDPTDRYQHGVLGDAIEWAGIEIILANGRALKITLPETRVFEDIAPRLFDIDNDGDHEIIVVETLNTEGAQLAIYDETGKIAATPHIGMRNRWLAPIGAADLDADGYIEVAYIDRPHLTKMLRVWRFKDGTLTEISQQAGLTNHRIGETDIGGGIRHCENGPEIITATANWRHIVATRILPTGQLETREIGQHTGRPSLNAALNCN